MTQNVFSSIFRLSETIGADQFFEQRIENDGNGNPLYVAWSPEPSASTSAEVWFIKKIYYDGNQKINRVQLPDNGLGFLYAWDSRATYFT